MNLLLRDLILSTRSLRRQGRRSVLAGGAITFGVVAMILAGGFIDWILVAMRETAVYSQLGHIQVTRPGFRDAGSADPYAFLLPQLSGEFDRIERLPRIKLAAARVAFNGLASRGDSTLSFVGYGVEPDKELLLSKYVYVYEGQEMSTRDPRGILLGKGLAANLGAVVGDTIVLMAGTASGGINAVKCRVRGLFFYVSQGV